MIGEIQYSLYLTSQTPTLAYALVFEVAFPWLLNCLRGDEVVIGQAVTSDPGYNLANRLVGLPRGTELE